MQSLPELKPSTVAAVPPPPTSVGLAAGLRDELAELGRRGYPGESCALLLGLREADQRSIQRLLPARNLRADERHDRYVLDPDAYVEADLLALRTGLDVVGVWHSHPDCPPIPSETDRQAAWPEWLYLIQTILAAGPGTLRAWELAGDQFVERPIHQE